MPPQGPPPGGGFGGGGGRSFSCRNSPLDKNKDKKDQPRRMARADAAAVL